MDPNLHISISELHLRQIIPTAPRNVDVFIPYLNKVFIKYEINTPIRLVMFIAQVAHESGGFRYTKELASGKAYEGREDLGNINPGDGVKYKGRGLIQVTGLSMYRHCTDGLFGDNTLLVTPDLLETPQYATLSAGWFWQYKKLNDYCDVNDFEGLTKRINGGLNGLEDRIQYLNRAKSIFSIE